MNTRSIPFFLLMIASLHAAADVNVDEREASRLHEIFESDWQRTLKENPERASMLGDRRYNRQWEDLSASGREQSHDGDVNALERLQAVDRELLSAADQVNYDLFERRYQDRLEAHQFELDLIPISQRGGIQTLDELGDRIRMLSVADYQDWLARLRQVDTLMDQTIALMREGVDKGVVPPRITMERVPAQIEKQLADTPEDSLFYKPFRNMPASISAADQARLRAEAIDVITNVILPAYRELYAFFTETYYPACRDSIAVSRLPNGRKFYEYAVRSFTTTSMTPDEVHELGLAEVARNREEMHAVMKEVGFEGTLTRFFEHLRTAPEFYYETPEELLEGYLAVSKRIDPKLVLLFGKMPRMPYGVIPIPEAIAPDTTTAYYSRPAADGSRPGYYYVNLYKPETRPKYEMEVLSVHEAVPGHHLQIALQMELESLPNFRRYSGFTAFTEGWGLYSERLGYEMGMYQDPYSRFGQLTYDMWRAIRLVVDTGMHYKGWTRQQAIDYFKANAAKTELDIINEIDRYISWPGQALAYKLGQLKMLELRARAEEALGDDFDVRAFHDALLSEGAVPLSVLETHMDNWLQAQLAAR